MTPRVPWHSAILRLLGWPGPAVVECPVGDFFAMGWNRYAQISSLAVCVNPGETYWWKGPCGFLTAALIRVRAWRFRATSC